MATELSSTTPTANKVHRCVYCNGWIAPGQTYHRWTWADQGTVGTCKAHPFCADLDWWRRREGWTDDELPYPEDFRSEYLAEAVIALCGAILPLPYSREIYATARHAPIPSRPEPALHMIRCQECQRPWGVIFEDDPSKAEALLRRTLEAEWHDRWRWDGQHRHGPPPPFPTWELYETEVLFISYADAGWLQETVGVDIGISEPPVWHRVGECELPAWWEGSRPKRQAVCFDCCNEWNDPR